MCRRKKDIFKVEWKFIKINMNCIIVKVKFYINKTVRLFY